MSTEIQRQTDSFRLGVKVRLFNYNLNEALYRIANTRAAQAEVLGIGVNLLHQYLNFKTYPIEERKLDLAIKLGVPVDAIFPESIAGVRLEKQPEALSFTAEEADAMGLVSIGPDPHEAAEDEERGRFVRRLLKVVTEREAKVLSLRFGLDGKSETYDQIGRRYGVTRERIRQIEWKARRKLSILHGLFLEDKSPDEVVAEADREVERATSRNTYDRAKRVRDRLVEALGVFLPDDDTEPQSTRDSGANGQ